MFTNSLTSADPSPFFSRAVEQQIDQQTAPLFITVPTRAAQTTSPQSGLFGTTLHPLEGMFGPIPARFTGANQPAQGSTGLFGGNEAATRGIDRLFNRDNSQNQGLFSYITEVPRPADSQGLFGGLTDRSREDATAVPRPPPRRAQDGRGHGARAYGQRANQRTARSNDSRERSDSENATIPLGSILAQPILGPKQMSATETGDGTPFACPVCCSDYCTSDKEKSKRPQNYECGHTMCLSCIEKLKDKKCPFCNKIGKQLSINYGLEHAIDWVKQSNSRSSELKMYQTHNLCLKCLETFDPNQKNLFSPNHKGHESITLKDKSPEQMKKAFWLLSILKSDEQDRFERTKIMLRMLLDIVDTCMQALVFAETELKSTKGNSTDELLEDIKTFISSPQTTENMYRNEHLMSSLLTLRDFEVTNARSVFSLAKDCKKIEQPQLTDEFFNLLSKDDQNYVPVGMPEEYMGKFPKLEFPTEDSGDTGELRQKDGNLNWLRCWRATLGH